MADSPEGHVSKHPPIHPSIPSSIYHLTYLVIHPLPHTPIFPLNSLLFFNHQHPPFFSLYHPLLFFFFSLLFIHSLFTCPFVIVALKFSLCNFPFVTHHLLFYKGDWPGQCVCVWGGCLWPNGPWPWWGQRLDLSDWTQDLIAWYEKDTEMIS